MGVEHISVHVESTLVACVRCGYQQVQSIALELLHCNKINAHTQLVRGEREAGYK